MKKPFLRLFIKLNCNRIEQAALQNKNALKQVGINKQETTTIVLNTEINLFGARYITNSTWERALIINPCLHVG